MFHIRNLFPETGRVENHTMELTPTNEQGQAICSLFLEFLSNRPPEFREPLAFLKRGNLELDWAAVAGGVGTATFFSDGSPVAMGVLLTGINPEGDSTMLSVFRQTFVEPLFGDQYSAFFAIESRPALLMVYMPGAPEQESVLQLLASALASVFFRCILQLQAEAAAEAQ